MSDFREKLLSLSFSRGNRGKSVNKPVKNEDTGGVAGFHTEHWDDRQDATVFAPAVKVKARADER